jgi:large subunit ribosomal protein L15
MTPVTLNNLTPLGPAGKKRRGQGIGSGKGGHTSGRGHKGQKARSSVRLLFEGTKAKKSLYKRLPLLRGKGKFKPRGSKFIAVNLKYLNFLPKGFEVTQESLVKAGIVSFGPAKILGEGEIKIPLIVKVPTSKSAAAKIVKAGGKVENAR